MLIELTMGAFSVLLLAALFIIKLNTTINQSLLIATLYGFLFLIAMASLFSFLKGITDRKVLRLWKQICKEANQLNTITFEKLSLLTNMSIESVVKSLYVLLQYEIFAPENISFTEHTLTVTIEQPYLKSLVQRTKKDSALPIYAVGLTWVLYALTMPMFRLIDFIAPALISVAIYFYTKALFAMGVTVIDKTQYQTDEDIYTAFMQKEAYVGQLAALMERIDNTQVKNAATQIYGITQNIFEFVGNNPQKAKSLRQLIEHYLPMVLNILASYQDMEDNVVKGEIVLQSMQKTESSIDEIVALFVKEQDNLYSDASLDISSDIDVLKSLVQK